MTTLGIPGAVLFIGACICGVRIVFDMIWEFQELRDLRLHADRWCDRVMLSVMLTLAGEAAMLAFLSWLAVATYAQKW
jgi:hypothetical protein